MAIKVANNQSLTAITALPAAVSGGAMTLLETQTASSSATLSFTSNIDSTYDEYQFHWINCHPSATDPSFTFQADTGTNTSYNQTITSTSFTAQNREDGDSGQASVGYVGGYDQAQGTAFQKLIGNIKNDSDGATSGILKLYSPSSSTFVKHFISVANTMENASPPVMSNFYGAGYFNTTTALTRVQFKMSSGNIDSGVIKLYGIS